MSSSSFGGLHRSLGLLFVFVCATLVGRADEPWLLLKTPHFRILSEASEARTREWGAEFEMFRRGMMELIPVESTALEPLTLVLFRSDRRLQPFKPQENGKPAKVSGYFAQLPGTSIIAFATEGARNDIRDVVYHEGLHWHLAGSERPRPRWLEEGLAQIFESFTLQGDKFVVGGQRPYSVRHVRVARPMPFARMMAADTTGLTFNGKHGEQTELFYHQSWLMAHSLVFGTQGPGIKRLARYLMEPAADFDALRDFERGFGISAAEMDNRVLSYIEQGRSQLLTVPFDRTTVTRGFEVAPAGAGEVDLILGSILVGLARVAEGEPYLWRAASALPNDPRVSEAFAIAKFRDEDFEGAERYCQEALRRGSKSFIVHCYLGQRALLELAGMRLSAPDPTEAVKHFMNCLKINPRFGPALEMISPLVPMLPERSPEAEAVVYRAAEHYPGSLSVQAGAALLMVKYSEIHAAEAAIARLRTMTTALPPAKAQRFLKPVLDAMEHRKTESAVTQALWSSGRVPAESVASPANTEATAAAEATSKELPPILKEVRRMIDQGRLYEASVVVKRMLEDTSAINLFDGALALEAELEGLKRLDMAKGLAASGQTEIARRLTQEVMEDNPPPALREKATALLKKLESP